MSRPHRRPLRFLAGERALEHVRDAGLTPGGVAALCGAAGGPKWLALEGLDRAVFRDWLVEPKPGGRALIGSSIATWRFACAAQPDPGAAFDRFRDAYLEQRYSAAPDRREISTQARRIVDRLLGPCGGAEILGSAAWRLQILAVRARGPLASERRALLTGGLAAAGVTNVVSRRGLGAFFRRTLFHHPEGGPPVRAWPDFPTDPVALSPENLRGALLASGSIPALMEPERDLPGAPPGVYRDGGLLDYQMDLPFDAGEGVVLFPHYETRVVPGWFDKPLPWRRARAGHTRDLLVVAPDPAWSAALPGGRVPDRRDFRRYAGDDEQRIRHWRAAVAAGRELADDFLEAVTTGAIRQRVEPLR